MNSLLLKKFKEYYPKFFKIIEKEKINNLLVESDYYTLSFLKEIILKVYDTTANINSSDVLYIESNPITIDTVRYITRFISYKPDNLNYRFVIIMNIENLTAEAGNALLKSLEESKKYVVFINLTSDSHKILKTILSRSMNFKLNPIDIKEKVPKNILKSINGSLGRYLLYLEEEKKEKKIKNIEEAIEIYINSFEEKSLYIYREEAFEFLKNYDHLQIALLIEEKSKKIEKATKIAIISDLCERLVEKNYKEIDFVINLKSCLELNLNFSTMLIILLKKMFEKKVEYV
jgi:DNA polymerase III delta prime subunit